MLNYNNQPNWPNNFGQQQSPINLISDNANFHQMNIPFEITKPYNFMTEKDDQTTIKLLGNGSAIIFNRPFQFVQTHFHFPSEHLINGTTFPFEIHLVHQNEIGQTVVVALMVSLGDSNSNIQSVIDNFATKSSKSIQINQLDWFPNNPTGYHYLGSLTTPPLTEGIEWIVIANPKLTISMDQLKWFETHFQPNNRNIQLLNQRQVYLYSN